VDFHEFRRRLERSHEAVRETVNFLAEQKIVPMSREEAYSLTSIVGDCRVSQVVDIRKGVHYMIPKAIFTKK
jgi:acetamidase/formamidase